MVAVILIETSRTDYQVLIEIIAEMELARTVVALVLLFRNVISHMTLKMICLCKGCLTNVTGEHFVSMDRSSVAHQC